MATRDPDRTENASPRNNDTSSTGDDSVDLEQRRTRVDATPLPAPASSSSAGSEVIDETERSMKDAVLLPSDIRETMKRNELVFPKEADTLTAHGVLPVRRDTMPILPTTVAAGSRPPHVVPPPPPPVRPSPRAMLVAAPIVDLLADDDLIDDDTQTQAEPFKATATNANEDLPTSPTISLESRSVHARDVYRLFLASEYAPALALANELIAQGDDDPMLVTIARECRSYVVRPPSSAPPPSQLFANTPSVRLNGNMTLDELTSMTGMSLDQVLGLLERFVAMGVITLRPPSR